MLARKRKTAMEALTSIESAITLLGDSIRHLLDITLSLIRKTLLDSLCELLSRHLSPWDDLMSTRLRLGNSRCPKRLVAKERHNHSRFGTLQSNSCSTSTTVMHNSLALRK